MLPLLFYLSGLINILGMCVLASGELTGLYNSYISVITGSALGGIAIPSKVSVSALYPTVFSPEGCFCIILWGMAYIAVANKYAQLPMLCLVFCIEKIFYTITWVNWYFSNAGKVFDISQQKPLVGLFFQIYGFNDAFFAVVFFVAFLVALFTRIPKHKTQ